MKKNKSKSNSFCALKLDMMKAYGRLEWPYLQAIMTKLGFAPAWVDIVMGMVKSVSFQFSSLVKSWCSSNQPEVFFREILFPLTFS